MFVNNIMRIKIRNLVPVYIKARRREFEAGLKPIKLVAKTRRTKTLTEQSFKEIERLLCRDFVPAWGDLKPKKITPRLFNEFCNSRDGDMANHRKVLNGFFVVV